MSKYVPAFDRSFLGLYGDAEATARTAKEFKILYQKQPGSTPERYTMDHSAGTYVFDPQGRLRLYVSYGQGAGRFRARHSRAAAHDRVIAKPHQALAGSLVLDQLDLVAIGIGDKRDHGRAALDRSGFAGHGTAFRAHVVAGRRGIGHFDRDVAKRRSEVVTIDAVVVRQLQHRALRLVVVSRRKRACISGRERRACAARAFPSRRYRSASNARGRQRAAWCAGFSWQILRVCSVGDFDDDAAVRNLAGRASGGGAWPGSRGADALHPLLPRIDQQLLERARIADGVE
jgi:hypothetical protein